MTDARTYRGYVWYQTRVEDRKAIVALAMNTDTPRQVLSLHSQLSVQNFSVVHWRRAHKARRLFLVYGSVLTAVDTVPWEIHEIEDPVAYGNCLAAFKTARRAL